MYKQLYIDTYSKILPSVEMEEKIYQKTINNNKKELKATTRTMILVVSLIIVFIGSVFSVSAATGNHWHNVLSSIISNDNATTELNIVTKTTIPVETTTKKVVESTNSTTNESVATAENENVKVKKLLEGDDDRKWSNDWVYNNGNWYFYNTDGSKLTGWKNNSEGYGIYYFDENGIMQTGWVKIDGKWYYFGDNGKKYDGGTYLIDGEYYSFIAMTGELITDSYLGSYYYDSSGVRHQITNESADYTDLINLDTLLMNYSEIYMIEIYDEDNDLSVYTYNKSQFKNILSSCRKEKCNNKVDYSPSTRVYYTVNVYFNDNTNLTLKIIDSEEYGFVSVVESSYYQTDIIKLKSYINLLKEGE